MSERRDGVPNVLARSTARVLGLLLGVGAFTAWGQDTTSMKLLADFDEPARWQVAASDDVAAQLKTIDRDGGKALCLEFDFGGVSGYAAIRRELPIEFPENYEFAIEVRGDAPANAFQFKLVDASGENVWWVERPDFAFPVAWERMRFKKRHVRFAWGPTQNRELRRSASLELVIARGRGGGRGSVCFDRLAMRELPAAVTLLAPRVEASSTLASSHPAQVFDGRRETAWESDPAAGARQSLTVDLGAPREFGGLLLHWADGAFAARYSIEFSDDGLIWRTVRRAASGTARTHAHRLPESETRFIRLQFESPARDRYALAEIELRDLEFGSSPNAFFSALAREAPRGQYPRGFVEQSYWTVLGVDGGSRHGLISEDGALELGPYQPSIEPFLEVEGRVISWADVEIEHSLPDGYLPMPVVTWQQGSLRMRIEAFGAGEPGAERLLAAYTLENRSDQLRTVTLALALRPFQVNPPAQFLNGAGGVAPIHRVRWRDNALSIEGAPRVLLLDRPTTGTVAPFDPGIPPGEFGAGPAAGSDPSIQEISDESGLASSFVTYRVHLPPHGEQQIRMVVQLAEAGVPKAESAASFDAERDRVAARWRERLNRVGLRVPVAAQPIADTLRTALAHMLITRSGPALQPGTRAYARSWIRDGAMMSDALLRLGHAPAAREFIDWFAPFQFANGKVPCCVDHRGADPVAENDSHGQLIYSIAEYFRFTRDERWLRTMWPRVITAGGHMNGLRLQERTAGNQTPERRALFGLMPASISHEGYSDRPAYSYWDDFWTLAGFDRAVALAASLGHGQHASAFARQRDEFRTDLHASIAASIRRHAIEYIPGSADRGDFDSTSTTIALIAADEQARLPRRALQATFERYWQTFTKRRDGLMEWNDYTPYEFRAVSAFVRLGWRTRAMSLLDGLLADRRPARWNQWAEVVGRLPREIRFIGDMPHGWIASDYIRAVLDTFVYERAEDQALVLAAGVPSAWFAHEGTAIERLRTPYGELTYSTGRKGSRTALSIAGGITPPPGGIVFRSPYERLPARVWVNGRPVRWDARGEVRVRQLPAVIEWLVP